MSLADKMNKVARASHEDSQQTILELQTLISKNALAGRLFMVYPFIVTDKVAEWLKSEGFRISFRYDHHETVISW